MTPAPFAYGERSMNAQNPPPAREHNYTDEEITVASLDELPVIRETLLSQIAVIQRQIAVRSQSRTLSAADYHVWAKSATNAIHLRERQLRDVKLRLNAVRREVRASLPGGESFMWEVAKMMGMLRRLRSEGAVLSDADIDTLARVEKCLESLQYDPGYGPVTAEDLLP